MMNGKGNHYGKTNSFKVKVHHHVNNSSTLIYQNAKKNQRDETSSKSHNATNFHGSSSMLGSKRPIEDVTAQENLNKRRKIDFVPPINPKNGFGTLSQPLTSSNSNGEKGKDKLKDSLRSTDIVKTPTAIGLFDPAIVNKYLGWTTVKRIGPGFYNEGNSCYLNSTLQCLLYIPALVQVLLSDSDAALKNIPRQQQNQLRPISEIFTSLVNEIWGDQNNAGNRKAILPRGMVSTIRRVGKQFKPFRQEDAHEYLRQLLDTMHEEVLKANRLKTSDGKPAETTFISRVFGGYLCNTLTCSVCGYASKTYNHFLDLSLEIRQGIQSLQDAISHFIKPEQLSHGNEWNCDGCKRKVKASKQMTISEAPPVLAVQLKRFAMSFGMSFMSNSKITKQIQFPLQLALPCTKQKNQPTVAYDLTGVVVHHGSTTHSGHYIAYVKAPNGIWYEMNDSSVSQVSVSRVQQAQAYLLFYSQKPKPMAAATIPSTISSKKEENTTSNNSSNTVSTLQPISLTITKKATTTTIDVVTGKPIVTPVMVEDEKKVGAKSLRFDTDTVDADESQDLAHSKKQYPPTPASKSMVQKKFSSGDSSEDDEGEDDEDNHSMGSASDLDSDIEDDMNDEDHDNDFPQLYCTHIFRYKSHLNKFRRWFWSKRPNLYKDRQLIRKFKQYRSMNSTKMILRKYLLVRQHIAGSFLHAQEDEESGSDEQEDSDSDGSEKNLFLKKKEVSSSVVPSAAVAPQKTSSSSGFLENSQKLPSLQKNTNNSDSDSENNSDEEESSVDSSDSSVDGTHESTEQDDLGKSQLRREPTMNKTATMDEILDLSRRSRTLGGEGVWEHVSDKAKQKVTEISTQQRREDQQHRKQYRLNEWDQNLDAGHVKKVKGEKMPLMDNTGANNPFQKVTERRVVEKREHLEAGEYEDYRGEVSKHDRKPREQQTDRNHHHGSNKKRDFGKKNTFSSADHKKSSFGNKKHQGGGNFKGGKKSYSKK